MVGTLAHDHFADHPIGNRLLRFPPLIGRCGLRAHLKHALRFPHSVDQLLDFLVGVTHRFLKVNVFTPVQSVKSDPRMPMIRRRNDYGVNIGKREQFAVIQETLGTCISPLPCVYASHRRRKRLRSGRRCCSPRRIW